MAHINYVEYVTQYNADIIQTRSNCSVRITNEGKVCFVDNGTRFHYNRALGPAYIRPTGVTLYVNPDGHYHRIDGPAKIFADGRKEYRIDGKKIPADEFFLKYGVL